MSVDRDLFPVPCRAPVLFQPNAKESNVGWGNSADPACLAEGARADIPEFMHGFVPQSVNLFEGEIVRDDLSIHFRLLPEQSFLAADIAGITEVIREDLPDIGGSGGKD